MKRILASLLLIAMLLPAMAMADGSVITFPQRWDDMYEKLPQNRPIITVHPDGTIERVPWWRGRHREYPQPVIIAPEPEPVYGRAGNGQVIWSTEYLYQVNVDNQSLDFRLFGDNNKKSVFLLSFELNSAGNQTMLLQDTRPNLSVTPVFTEKALTILKTKKVDTVIVTTKGGDSTTYSMADLEAML